MTDKERDIIDFCLSRIKELKKHQDTEDMMDAFYEVIDYIINTDICEKMENKEWQ